MSGLSGYDSEVVGFDSIPPHKNTSATSSAQTTEYSEETVASQTSCSRDVGCTARPDLGLPDDVPAQQPPGLNEFLRRVAPLVMEQLDQNDRDFLKSSSDSDEEETLTAKLIQEIRVPDHSGSGDHDRSILSVSWSSGGNSFVASYGQLVHDTWCRSAGSIKLYTYRRSEDSFAVALEISEKNCITVLRYHPSVAALLAYGTTAGEVVLCALAEGSLAGGTQLASPPHCHAGRRVSALHWADATVANQFLLIQIRNKKKRRGASDQVLVSSGSNGTINAWQVNSNHNVFENIISYSLNNSRKSDAPDITCFDFMKHHVRSSEQTGDVFVVGSSTGGLFLCKVSEAEDPVVDQFDGHATAVLDVAFSPHRPGIFVSLSMDSELRVYDVSQGIPLKVVSPDVSVSCISWLQGSCVAAGLAGGAELLRVYNLASGRPVPVGGLAGSGHVTSIAVTRTGLRIAAGDKNGTIRVWELPPHCKKWNCESLMQTLN